jgi:hypothetical protein
MAKFLQHGTEVIGGEGDVGVVMAQADLEDREGLL